MYIQYSEEQQMLRDSAEKYLRDNYSFDDRAAVVKSDQPFSAERWQTFADMGWLAMTFSEEQGGFDGAALETMLLCEQFGKYLVLEPYLETVVLAGGMIEASATDALKARYLPGLIAGNIQGAVAFQEAAAMNCHHHLATTASPSGNGYRLDGSKAVVLNGPAADVLLVTARTSGGVDDKDGISVFAVASDSAGISKQSYKTYDGRSACELTLSGVSVHAECLLGQPGEGLALLDQFIQRGILAVCAEAVGAMDSLLDATVNYTRQRKQFGKPIADFQVLRHRMVDMLIELELCRSLLMATAWKLDNGATDAGQCLSALKAKVGKSARFVAHNAIQLHGGIGTTNELSVGHYFKRLTTLGVLFGSSDQHLVAYLDQALHS
jgi:alkylation response protein AidB-like acyl-CoA dehydrogenase